MGETVMQYALCRASPDFLCGGGGREAEEWSSVFWKMGCMKIIAFSIAIRR